jgi:hypothetical protein
MIIDLMFIPIFTLLFLMIKTKIFKDYRLWIIKILNNHRIRIFLWGIIIILYIWVIIRISIYIINSELQKFDFKIYNLNILIDIIIIIIGSGMNYLAIGLNGGKMPVYIGKENKDSSVMKIHKFFNSRQKVRVFILTDIIRIPNRKSAKGYSFMSIGDLLILCGLSFLIINMLITLI